MYLKSIEINGFKSFANKIVFEFPHGITGIVGPNGSGKSNIGDAVRWVLGEQSAKQLRGSRMEDVIFSGTESRRPLGFAYVAIVFDNADRKIALDYDEVKVARRVYRSGESDYLINGAACRRRDIVEIFYDTGIGKEGYSIIGQGQVEKILSGKIEDSRELFDEAAGIAKYKKNRSVTEKSLEQERQNLERVTDVLRELEERVGPLSEQSRTAKEYLKLRDREKDLDIHLFLYDHDHMQEELKELARQQEIVEKDLNTTRQTHDRIREKNQSLQSTSEMLLAQIEKAEGERDALSAKKEELDSRNLLLHHQTESNARMIAHYEEIIEQSLKEKEAKRKQMEEQREKLSLEKEKILELEQSKKCLEEEKRQQTEKKQRISEQLSVQKDAIFSMMDDQLDTKEKLSRYDTMEEQLLIRNAEYNSRLIALQSDLKDYNGKSEKLEEALQATQQKYDDALADLEKEQQEEDRTSGERNRLSAALGQENQNFLRARSRYETLAGITERYEGYNQSIKHIMEQKKNNPGIIGVVADIMELDKKYETAIEIALGGALQNVVTEDDQVAKKMIAFLKQNRFGRATFLPLTNIRKRSGGVHPSVLEEEGVVGLASDLVSVEARFESLVQHLLGRTVVVDTIENALRLSRRNNYSLRVVTIGGELLNPGGSITGGAYRHSGNLLGRKREMEESREKMEQARAACANLQNSLRSLDEEQEKRQGRLQEKQEIVNALKLSLHDLGHQIPDLLDKEKDLKETIETLKEEHASLKKQLMEIRGQKEELAQSQLSHEKIHEQNNDAMDRLEKELAALEESIRDVEARENQVILHISQSGQQAKFHEAGCSRLEGEMADCDSAAAANRTQKEELQRQNEEAEKEQQKIAGETEDLAGRLREMTDSLAGLKEEQKAVSRKHAVIFRELEEQNERMLILEKENARLSSRKEKVESDLESRVDYMWDNYELTYNYALELKHYDVDESGAAQYRREKKEVAQQIKKLGSVNVGAIEEYKTVGERYEFLRGQYDDIKEAEEKLLTMIDELNTAMREQFTEKFAEIRQMFTTVFQDLFEGGTADLELMDDDNMLECGIRIVAQPPGKKLQNIMLLSGGERALTAIALLFAIQKLKPSPFCLLDEIEAALDDANIVRFSKYLRRLSADTQFIVITHRRGTMAAAEALYGITMQEKGVSTLISVDLIDKQLDA